MAGALALGMTIPEGGPFVRDSLTAPFVVAVLFLSGYTLDLSNFLRQARNFRAIALSLTSTFIVAPVVAYGAVSVWGPAADGTSTSREFLEAIMIVAAQGGTLVAAVVFTRIAAGEIELALVVTALSNALTAVATPLVLYIALGEDVAIPVLPMIQRIALVIVLPLIVGQVVRRLVWTPSPGALSVIRVLPQLIVLSFVYTAVSVASEQLADAGFLVLRFFAACISLHAVMLVWMTFSARALGFPRNERVALLFSGAQKTMPNGMYVWTEFFAANPYGALALALHHALQLVGGNLIAAFLGRRSGPG